MATMCDPSLSTSITRPSLASANAPSMADTLPSINFGFDDLRDRMARFTDRFDEFIAKGRKRVLEERNQFRLNVAELQEDQRLKKRELEILSQKTQAYAHSLSKEAAETAEMRTAIASITTQRDLRASHRDRLRVEITLTQKQINQRLAAQQQHAKEMDAQARFNEPELGFWMDYLCLRIEGAGRDDRLKFVFDHLDEWSWEREAWFEVDTERRDYRVVTVRPKLDGEEVERRVERWNENRDLSMFLKGMRGLFVAAMNRGPGVGTSDSFPRAI